MGAFDLQEFSSKNKINKLVVSFQLSDRKTHSMFRRKCNSRDVGGLVVGQEKGPIVHVGK